MYETEFKPTLQEIYTERMSRGVEDGEDGYLAIVHKYCMKESGDVDWTMVVSDPGYLFSFKGNICQLVRTIDHITTHSSTLKLNYIFGFLFGAQLNTFASIAWLLVCIRTRGRFSVRV